MKEFKIYEKIDSKVLEQLLNTDEPFNQINIYVTEEQYRNYVAPYNHFELELNSTITDIMGKTNYPVMVSSFHINDKRINIITSDYYLKNKNIEARYINDDSYSVIQDYILNLSKLRKGN